MKLIRWRRNELVQVPREPREAKVLSSSEVSREANGEERGEGLDVVARRGGGEGRT